MKPRPEQENPQLSARAIRWNGMTENLYPTPLREATESTLEITWERSAGLWVIEVGNRDFHHLMVLSPGERAVLGSGQSADLRIEDCTVSARHCAVAISAEGPMVEDLSSLNGTLLGEARIGTARLPARAIGFVVGQTAVVVRPTQKDDLLPLGPGLPRIIGTSGAMRRVARDVHRLAPLQAPVLVQGESGTGKDLVPRALHDLGKRPGRFVPMNVGAIAENLVDSELFGHRKGAFTGAVTSRPGAFEEAHQGTLFLDEVAELSAAGQVKLLRVVEDGCVRPVGAMQTVQVAVRLVSATWAPLSARVAGGGFRGDLYHRLALFLIELPPLRERKTDVPALCCALLRRGESELGPKRLSAAALAKLVAYDWPGNVRELQGVLYRAAVQCVGEDVIRAEHVCIRTPSCLHRKASMTDSDAMSLVKRFKGNVSAAARAAGVARSTFRSWLERGQNNTPD